MKFWSGCFRTSRPIGNIAFGTISLSSEHNYITEPSQYIYFILSEATRTGGERVHHIIVLFHLHNLLFTIWKVGSLQNEQVNSFHTISVCSWSEKKELRSDPFSNLEPYFHWKIIIHRKYYTLTHYCVVDDSDLLKIEYISKTRMVSTGNAYTIWKWYGTLNICILLRSHFVTSEFLLHNDVFSRLYSTILVCITRL